MAWIDEAYALPFEPLGHGLPWAAASVERWADRVVVQVVAPADQVARIPCAALAPDCDWSVRFASGRTSPLAAGRADEGEGTTRCYLMFYADEGDQPSLLSGRIDGVAAAARLTRLASP